MLSCFPIRGNGGQEITEGIFHFLVETFTRQESPISTPPPRAPTSLS